jgi:acyl carrier protein
MKDEEKFAMAFKSTFFVEDKDLPDLKYQAIPAWDSVGHMALIAELEKTFNVTMEIDDVIELSSYSKGQEILKKYGVTLKS